MAQIAEMAFKSNFPEMVTMAEKAMLANFCKMAKI